MRILVVQTLQEKRRVEESPQEIVFNLVIPNDYGHLRYIEGLRVKEVFITPEVLTQGLDPRLFNYLSGSLVSMSVDPKYAFHIYYL